MSENYREAMNLFLIQVRHIREENFDILGIFNESDVQTAKETYLQHAEHAGCSRENFVFRDSSHILGEINY